MTHEPTESCPWTERVSALIDGELPLEQREMVTSHAQTCSTCFPLFDQDRQIRTVVDRDFVGATGPSLAFPIRHSLQLRVLLAVIGILIVVGSLPGFVRGSTDGNSLHDLRHLAIWQVAIGVGVLSASISFRISRLLTVMISTFLLLTAIATIYDLATGHRGPWTDPLHLVEIAAVLAIMRLIYPHLTLLRSRNLNPTQR